MNLSKKCQSFCQKSVKFGANALRHYFGTQLLLKGVPASKVAKLMGNSVRVIEKHYAHIANTTDVLD